MEDSCNFFYTNSTGFSFVGKVPAVKDYYVPLSTIKDPKANRQNSQIGQWGKMGQNSFLLVLIYDKRMLGTNIYCYLLCLE